MSFYKSNTHEVIQALKSYGNCGLISQWLNDLTRWASVNDTPEARAIKTWLPMFRPKPIYTAKELSPILPALALHMGLAKKWTAPMPESRTRALLNFCEVPKLINSNGTRLFFLNGTLREYYIVGFLGKSQKLAFTQQEFERIVK